MTEDEARAEIATWHTPKLDALRVAVRGMRTSLLIAHLLPSSDLLVDALGDELDDADRDERTGLLAAAAVACCDEIDRRMPVPAEESES